MICEFGGKVFVSSIPSLGSAGSLDGNRASNNWELLTRRQHGQWNEKNIPVD